MPKFTIELEKVITVLTGKTGKAIKLEMDKIPESVVRTAAINGFISALNDVSRGKDENDKPNSDDVWQSLREKRAQPWYSGEWSFSRQGSGASIVGRMREAYVEEQAAAHGVSPKVIEAKVKETVSEVFGKDESATFPRFLDALATVYCKQNAKADFDDIRQQLEAKYRDKAIELAAERSKAVEGLDLTDITI